MMFSCLVAAILAVGLAEAEPKDPQWEESYGKALQETRKSASPLLVVLDKPNSKSARLKPELLGQKSSDKQKAELLKPYRLCHVDVTTEYGKQVADAFHATTFPDVAIIDKTGSKVIFRKTGQIKSDEWQEILTENRRGEGPIRRVLSRITHNDNSSGSRSYCPNCQRHNF